MTIGCLSPLATFEPDAILDFSTHCLFGIAGQFAEARNEDVAWRHVDHG